MMRLAIKAALSVVFLCLANATIAQQSCWARDYSDAHLAKHPDQVVRQMVVLFEGQADGPGELGQTAGVEVFFRDDPRPWSNGFYCPPDAEGGALCAIDCDGGAFVVSWRDVDTILLKTNGFVVGVHCDGEEEPKTRNVSDTGAAETVFLLRRTGIDACPADWVQ